MDYAAGGSKGDGGVLKVEESAVAAYAPSAVGAVEGWGDIVSPRRAEVDAWNGREHLPFEKKMEILKKYAECHDTGKEYPGDIHFDLYGEPGPDKSDVGESVPEEVLREVESYHFVWVENDDAGMGDVVSPLYKDVY